MLSMSSAEGRFEANALRIACMASIHESAGSNKKIINILTAFRLTLPRYLVLLHPEHELLKLESGQLLSTRARNLNTWKYQWYACIMCLVHTSVDSRSSESFVLDSEYSDLDSGEVVARALLSSSWST